MSALADWLSDSPAEGSHGLAAWLHWIERTTPMPTRLQSAKSVLGWLRDTGRATYLPCTDDEALDAFARLARTEGIIPALETSHALAKVETLDAHLIVVCLSGRGDKDLAEALTALAERDR